MPDVATIDGYDVQMQTNHLSHFLLASIVLPALQTAAEVSGSARIVSHSSASRKSPGTPCDAKYYGKNGGDLGGDDIGPRWERYHQSKLANVLFSGALKVCGSPCAIFLFFCTPSPSPGSCCACRLPPLLPPAESSVHGECSAVLITQSSRLGRPCRSHASPPATSRPSGAVGHR